jgi:hypothetical protein
MPPKSNSDRDTRVDDYIARLPTWQQQICQQLRKLIHQVDPDMIETIKRSVQPYFVLDGNVCALLVVLPWPIVWWCDGGAGGLGLQQ